MEEGSNVFGFEAGEGAEFLEGDEGAFLLFVVLADAGHELAGRAFSPAGDVHDIFGIDDDTVGNGVHGIRI